MKIKITELSVEKYYPYLVALSPVGFSFLLGSGMKSLIATQVANSVLTVLAIVIAFVSTSMTILLTAPDNSAVAILRTTGGRRGLKNLISYHSQTVAWGLISCLLSLAVLIVCRNINSPLKHLTFILWVYLVALSLLLFERVVRLLHTLLMIAPRTNSSASQSSPTTQK